MARSIVILCRGYRVNSCTGLHWPMASPSEGMYTLQLIAFIVAMTLIDIARLNGRLVDLHIIIRLIRLPNVHRGHTIGHISVWPELIGAYVPCGEKRGMALAGLPVFGPQVHPFVCALKAERPGEGRNIRACMSSGLEIYCSLKSDWMHACECRTCA